jgi:hypothetical protein
LNKEEAIRKNKDDKDDWPFKKVVSEIMNPKSLNVDEFFGYYDLT